MDKDILRFGIQIVHPQMLDAWQWTDLLVSLLGNPNLHALAVLLFATILRAVRVATKVPGGSHQPQLRNAKRALGCWKGICWGWHTTQVCGDYFVNHDNKDPVIKQVPHQLQSSSRHVNTLMPRTFRVFGQAKVANLHPSHFFRSDPSHARKTYHIFQCTNYRWQFFAHPKVA